METLNKLNEEIRKREELRLTEEQDPRAIRSMRSVHYLNTSLWVLCY